VDPTELLTEEELEDGADDDTLDELDTDDPVPLEVEDETDDADDTAAALLTEEEDDGADDELAAGTCTYVP
jgi:hypothetical protein